jgi:hypothetical protein
MASARPPRRPAFYVDPAQFAALVRRQRRERAVSNDLGVALSAIAGGVWDKFRFTADRDEFVNACFLHFMGAPLRSADPRRNLFSYFTTCAVRFGGKQRNKLAAERRKFAEYAADLARAGRVPVE